ncbi:MAG: hypothetical protein CO186_13055 [Zetaproteobacteria bacterium CG_4_9_14_3_um_filter_49_83]|nr:MAG: hypothetical protein AUJ56_03215 [Zetaproteobacteria bacterium CG1_02_49_23]PIQ33158.1 MAG: hypothetical protein COW62_06060 [Zetaproteobacteria bacterium CG17_big_fil_post_rev_8_21_14_2_50_50_13]PIV29362.1 MAG: hypothetical protein COS35_12400 [Zetaproteobacteria bacterium CG02_land_8_20_14_3_00_50_9]PIY54796.1 MAG: hypothetical protein COZ00_12790 [Zetaproteobacteria bacterium CG_4_10_14_0_8_um_filter_49_80]PJA33677.1 MAG: hypothetical protein CO186_13055 [Zetaproteobacteria bacterium
MYYDKLTRWFHVGLALLVPLQLLSEELMKRPKPGRIRTDEQIFFFEMHEWVGMTLLSIVVLHMLWSLRCADEGGWKRLFPYLTSAGRCQMLRDIQAIPAWFKGKVPSLDDKQALPGAIHGLGLLLVLVLVLGTTGAMMLYGMEESGRMVGIIDEAKEFHELMGGLVWLYLIGHVGMVVVHRLLGHPILQRISPFSK